MRRVILTYILCRILKWFNDNHYVIQLEASRSFGKTLEFELEKRKGFVLNNDGWLVKGFVYIRPLDDCIEIKTVSKTNKSIFISQNKDSFDACMKYLYKFINA